jgi:hypothetical protein
MVFTVARKVKVCTEVERSGSNYLYDGEKSKECDRILRTERSQVRRWLKVIL